MEFKIDTTATYTTIGLPEGRIDATMAAALHKKCTELAETDSQNFLIDAAACHDADAGAAHLLSALHEECYASGRSLVFAALQAAVLSALKAAGLADALNISPTKTEAIDIISMEILERDLLSEE